MFDTITVISLAAVFSLALGYVRGCDHLKGMR